MLQHNFVGGELRMLDSNLEEEEMILKMPIFLLPPDPEPEEGEEDGKED